MSSKFFKVALYIRVSTREQAESGYSISEQETRLRNYCKAMNWGVVDLYADPGYSGAKMDRPGLQDLLSAVHDGKCDAVLVWKLDRLSRSQKDTLYLIEDQFLSNGVAFVSMLESFDTSTPFGRAMIGILSVFAQLEREQIRERMAMGADARAKEGLWHGGGYDPIGYDYIDGRLVVNDYEALQIREIYDLYINEKWAVHKIKMHMSKKFTLPKKKTGKKSEAWWSDSSINSVLRTPIYCGIISWKGNEYQGQHEQIITRDQYQLAQKRIAETSFSNGRQKSPFATSSLCGGLIVCGNCGAKYFAQGAYSGHGANKKYWPYYSCYSRAKSNRRMIKDENCKNKRFPVFNFDQMIISQIKELSFNPKKIDELSSQNDLNHDLKMKRDTLNNRLKDLRSQVDRLITLCRVGGDLPIQEIAMQIETAQSNIKKTELAIASLPKEPVPLETKIANAKTLALSAAEILDSDNLEEKRKIVLGLIDKIVITQNGDVEISWAF